MQIRLDRTACDGFGVCGDRAPSVFSVDEWGYASLADRTGTVPPHQEDDVRRAIHDCPVSAIARLEDGADPPRWTPEPRGRRAMRNPAAGADVGAVPGRH